MKPVSRIPVTSQAGLTVFLCGIADNTVKLVVVFVLPSIFGSHGLCKVCRCAPSLLGCLMQVSLRQVILASVKKLLGSLDMSGDKCGSHLCCLLLVSVYAKVSWTVLK